jgi:hypothetical protein
MNHRGAYPAIPAAANAVFTANRSIDPEPAAATDSATHAAARGTRLNHE